MGKKYVVEIGRLERLYKASISAHGKPEITWLSPEVDLTPYTKPDTEAAYAHGYSNAEIKYRAEVKEAYQKGLSDAWEAARKIAHCALWEDYRTDTGKLSVYTGDVLDYYTASEAIEKIRAHEQAQKELEQEKEEEKPIRAEDVMRQYLKEFCKKHDCEGCVLNASDFVCGRVADDEEVRRAYAEVLQKMSEN